MVFAVSAANQQEVGNVVGTLLLKYKSIRAGQPR